MNLKLVIAALIIAPLALTACTKKEEAPNSEAGLEASADVQISAEQQAAIDSVDQPDPAAIAIDETLVAEAENAAANAEETAPVEAEVAAQPDATTDTAAQ